MVITMRFFVFFLNYLFDFLYREAPEEVVAYFIREFGPLLGY